MFAIRLFSTCSLALALSAVWANNTMKPISFPNGELPTLRKAQNIGPLNPEQEITFTVWLKLRNKEKLDQFSNELYDPQSPHYQQFLSTEDYNTLYAPSAETIKKVVHYFTSNGMKAKQVHTTIRVTGKVKAIEQLLQIKLNQYRYHNKLVYGNTSVAKISPEIAPFITGISDLSNIPYGHPKIRQEAKLSQQLNTKEPVEVLNLVWDSFVPQALPTTTSLQGFKGQQMRIAYNLAGVVPINGQTINGSGQTIVIIDGCGDNNTATIRNDANVYSASNALPLLTPSNFAVVNYNGAPYVKGSMSCDSSWDGEIALDIQASHTMAPGANIVVVMTEDVTNHQVATAINHILSNQFSIGGFSNAYVVSNSWDNDYDLQNENLDSTLQTASAMGLSLNFAAGDCGDQTYNSSWTCSKMGNSPSIQYPVSSTYVTAVSGTSLFVDSTYNYAFESGWGNYKEDNNQVARPYSGSMGGISQWRSFPSWQAPISTFTAGGYGTVGSHNRAIPDIAMDADYFTGLIIYEGGQFYKTGGASQSTPLFSGVVTLVNQARAIKNKGVPKPIGLVAPYFYTYNNKLITSKALNLVSPPHQIISGATPVNNAPAGTIPPDSSFNILTEGKVTTFNWDGVLSIVENQFWNDVVGVGSPNVPNFVEVMSTL